MSLLRHLLLRGYRAVRREQLSGFDYAPLDYRNESPAVFQHANIGQRVAVDTSTSASLPV